MIDRITRSRFQVAMLLRDDMNEGVPDEDVFTPESVLLDLRLELKSLPAFPIEWEDASADGANDPFDCPPWLLELEGRYEKENPGEIMGNGYVALNGNVALICSIASYGGRTTIYWVGKKL